MTVSVLQQVTLLQDTCLLCLGDFWNGCRGGVPEMRYYRFSEYCQSIPRTGDVGQQHIIDTGGAQLLDLLRYFVRITDQGRLIDRQG